MDKPQLLIYLIVYLVLVTTICSFTYAKNSPWIPSIEGLGEESYAQNFQNVNVSDLNLKDIKGSWDIEDNKLVAKRDHSEFWIYTGDIVLGEGGYVIAEYNFTNIPDKVKLYIGKCSYLGRAWRTYWELDPENDKLFFKREVKRNVFTPYEVDETNIFAFSYPFGDSSYYSINITARYLGDGVETNVALVSDCSITNDEGTNFVASVSGLPEMKGFLWMKGGTIAETGVYTEKSGLEISYMKNVKKENVKSSAWDVIPLITEIIFFNPPELGLPYWLHFLLFYIPMIGAIVLIVCIIRGI